MRTKTWSIRIKEWFPVGDPVARLLVKLLTLREDFLLELAGMAHGLEATIHEPQLGSRRVEANLDENSSAWRRLYFYRNSLKTHFEIHMELEAFYENAEGITALGRESVNFRSLLEKLRDEMTRAKGRVERLRHTLGGHVSSGAIKTTLRDMHSEVNGLLQIGEMYGKTRYKFVGEIVMRMMLPGVTEDQLPKKLDQLLEETSQLIPVFRTIDNLMGAYITGRRLLT